MRTLNEITAAIRSCKEYTEKEARYAVIAYDVLLAQLSVDLDPVRLETYFRAAEAPPIDYIEWVNDPENPEAVHWYEAMSDVTNV